VVRVPCLAASGGVTEYRIDFQGLAESEKQLLRLAALLRDLRPFWPQVSRLFISWISRQFESEGAFLLGHRWEPLSPEYARRKALMFPGKGILSAEGDLRRAATSLRRIAEPRRLILEIEPYEKRGRTLEPSWFQDSTTTMPARPLLAEELPGVAERELEEAADRYVVETVRRLGLA
jgi:hypothetical protein